MSTISLRPETDADLPFLRQLYASTLTDELTPLPWIADQVASCCRQQFEAQRGQFRQHYPDARFSIVMVNGVPAGRLYVHLTDAALTILDVALLPSHRRRGVGRRLLLPVLDQADVAHLPVRLHVERDNPVAGWCRRHGFVIVGEVGPYWEMERPVVGAAAAVVSAGANR